MADSNQYKRADISAFSENDPFAELTRIMGHDPRAGKPDSGSVDDDFDIDLEKELMGDFAEFDEPAEPPLNAPETAASWQEASAPLDDSAFEESHGEQAQDFAGEETGRAESFEPSFEAETEALDQELDSAFSEGFEVEPYEAAQDLRGDAVSHVEPVADFAETEQWSQGDADEIASYDAAPAESADGMADVDMDFGFLDDELKADHHASQPEPQPYGSEWEQPAAVPADSRSEAYVEPAAAADLSLEDELTALLADDAAPAVAQDELGGWHQPEPDARSYSHDDRASPEDGWQPTVKTFGGSHAAEEWSEAEHDSREDAPAYEHSDADFSDENELAGEDDAVGAEPAAIPFVPLSGQVPPRPAMQAAEPQPVSTSWDAEPAQAGYEQSAYDRGDDAPDVETVDVSESAYAIADDLDIPELVYEAPPATLQPYDDIESEFSQAFGSVGVDDSDYSAEAAGAVPDAPGESGHRFGFENYGYSAAGAAAVAASAPATAAADPYSLGEGHWQPDELAGSEGYNYESDLEQAIAMSAYENEAEAPQAAPRKRGLLIAAVVAGVAVIGGLGVFGMSLFGSDGGGAPAVVRADSDPLKIRPENPGGAKVPNQDNEVYQRVGGSGPDGSPEQERLITTAEEPVDVTAPAASQSLAPGMMVGDPADEPAQPAGSDMAAAQPKGEDRIEQVAEDAGVGAEDDLVAVAPRRVRTMVVRPDGTMVPREDPAPAAAPEAASDTLTAATPSSTGLPGVDSPITAAPALAPVGSPALETADAAENGPVVNTPPTVSVVPSQRVDQQVAAAQPARVEPQPAAPRAVEQAPAATPVSAPAAAAPVTATGEWSMQIASQPTAEGAQSTYQDLARRYGGVLEGRGVNIVRADIAGKGVYYRVRIPASNRDEAIQLCTQYKSAGGSCFVSR